MAKILKFKRGNTAKNTAYTGADGELTVDTSKKTVIVHDGVTAGGSVLATESLVGTKINSAEKGVANGVATLDVNGKVVLTQIPDSVLGQLEYMGTYSFSGGMPTATQKGQYWIASTDGNGYITGDWAVWNGTSFDKVDNTDAVATVAGRTGNVVLTKSDVGLNNVDNTSDSNKPVSTATQNALNLKANNNTVVKLTGDQTIAGIKTFSSTIVGNITGNSGTATKLQTAITINGVAFDGTGNITVADSTKAPLASPVLTGTPTAPTAAVGTSTTQLATTAFVLANSLSNAPFVVGSLKEAEAGASNWIQTTTPTKKHEYKVKRSGTLTVVFAITQWVGQEYNVYPRGQIYVNNVARGTLRAPNASSGTYTEDITVNKGDLLQIYVWGTYTNNDVRVTSSALYCNNPTTTVVIVL